MVDESVKNLYICGCSFLTDNKNISKTNAGKELAKRLGLRPLEYAAGGRGNDRIIAATKQFFYLNSHIKHETFALIGWSSSLRKDCLVKRKNATRLYDDNKYWKTLRYTDMSRLAIQEYRNLSRMDVANTLRLHHIMNILNLQDFFKVNGIKYCMYDALDNQWKGKGQWRNHFESEIDKSRFFGFNTLSHFDFVNKKGNEHVPEQYRDTSLNCDGLKKPKASYKDEHPNSLGHSLWADKLQNFIKENNLL
tara:strand:+ start:2031 stop:2780 length:750 start_codon:yes stop_codon:yes gene_type:complete